MSTKGFWSRLTATNFDYMTVNGHHMGFIVGKLSDVLFGISFYIFMVLWFTIGLNWLIKTWGWIPSMFSTLLGLSIFHQLWCRNTFKNIRITKRFKRYYLYRSQPFGHPQFLNIWRARGGNRN